MSMIVLGSIKASPGVTTTALALGATWPHDRNVLVAEFDRAGGDIAARFGLPSEPGLVSLAAATRHKTDSADLVLQHTQKLQGGLSVLIAPPSSGRTRAAMAMLKPELFASLPGVDVLADLGRIETTDDTSTAMVEAADLVVIVVRPVIAELHHLEDAALSLSECNANVALVINGRGPYERDDIEHTLNMEAIGSLPHDVNSAESLAGTSISVRGFSRLPLLRSARTLAEAIVSRLGEVEGSVAEDVA